MQGTLTELHHGTMDSTIDSMHKELAMEPITANSLKTQGIAAIERALAVSPEATVSVRGKDRFVVMELEHYRYLRECELEAALAESRADMAAGRFVRESVDAHLQRLATL